MDRHALLDRFFAPDGPLKKAMPGYAPRAAQVEMAHAVLDTLLAPKSSQARRLVVEAGTGVGKSLAYLAPALVSQKRVVVTTATKALQDQLYVKDVPTAWRCMQQILREIGAPDVVLVKGRQNYLCKLKFETFASQPMFMFPGDVDPWPGLVKWAGTTATGDRAEMGFLPEPYGTWTELDAKSEHCLGTACMHHEECFVTQLKRKAEEAKLIVANHHLLCADLRVRSESRAKNDAATAWVLPTVDAYILDEAHTLPDVASDWFGVELSSLVHERLLVDARRFADGRSGDERAKVLDQALSTEEKVRGLWKLIHAQVSSERARFELGPELHNATNEAERALKDMAGVVESLSAEPLAEDAQRAAMETAARDALARRLNDARAELAFALLQAPHDEKFVVCGEAVGQHKNIAQVTATPVDVAQALERTVLGLDVPVVFASATLAVNGSVRGFKRRVGLWDNTSNNTAVEKVLPSPFDYARRSALYCPLGMPEPDKPDYVEQYKSEATFLLETVQGGALFLYTSYAAMDQGYAHLSTVAKRMGLVCKKQGDAQKGALLEELRAADGQRGMVLCATHSFWEGVDVKGRALRLVCIDRLPFKVPTDPVRRARADLCQKRGGDPFMDIAVPEAALALKQGAGRLLRDVEDAGIVAILDGRLRTRRYGAMLLKTLPPMTKIGGQKPLADFYARFVAPALSLS